MEKIVIIPEGVCADRIVIEVDKGVLGEVVFEGGCDGNGKALASLLKGMPAEKAMDLLAGVQCGEKGTSCADQFSLGLRREVVEK